MTTGPLGKVSASIGHSTLCGCGVGSGDGVGGGGSCLFSGQQGQTGTYSSEPLWPTCWCERWDKLPQQTRGNRLPRECTRPRTRPRWVDPWTRRGPWWPAGSFTNEGAPGTGRGVATGLREDHGHRSSWTRVHVIWAAHAEGVHTHPHAREHVSAQAALPWEKQVPPGPAQGTAPSSEISLPPKATTDRLGGEVPLHQEFQLCQILGCLNLPPLPAPKWGKTQAGLWERDAECLSLLSTVWNLHWPFTSLPASSQLFRALMQTVCRAACSPSPASSCLRIGSCRMGNRGLRGEKTTNRSLVYKAELKTFFMHSRLL